MVVGYVVGATILALIVASVVYQLTSNKLPLPPGPPAEILSGNVHQVPKSEPWRTFAKWSEIYGV